MAHVFLLLRRQLDSTVGGQASLSQFISGKKALVAFFYPKVSHQLSCSSRRLHWLFSGCWPGSELGAAMHAALSCQMLLTAPIAVLPLPVKQGRLAARYYC